jgi:predicted amidophosphoribosyltransferase
MKSWKCDLILFVLASPILVVRGLVRAGRRLRFLRMAMQPSIVCSTCGSEISLVGFWRCPRCGFTGQSHLCRPCLVCGDLPSFVRCYKCAATERIRV